MIKRAALRVVTASGVLLLASCSSAPSSLAAEMVVPQSAGLPVNVFSPTPRKLDIPEASVRPAELRGSVERPLLAVDIDETLTDTDYNYLMWGTGKDDTTALPGSQQTLSRLAASFDIVYLTARSRSMKGKTERWLARNNFPTGRVVTSPTVGDFIFQGNFKQNAIRKLRKEHPNMVVGIGDKAKDGKAYRNGDMVSVIVNPWPKQEYHQDDIVLRDWAAVSEFFKANHNVLSNPRLVRDALNGGGPGLTLTREAREFPGRS